MRKYRTDQMAHMDMHSIVDDLYERATEFVHKSGLHMHDDFVGKLHDLIYGLSYVSQSRRVSGDARCGLQPVAVRASALRRKGNI